MKTHEQESRNEVIVEETTIPASEIPKSVTVEDLVSRGWSEKDAKTIIETRDAWEA